MAFQSILDTLSATIHRDTIVNPILESQIDPLRKSIETFPYKIPNSAIQFFLNNGIAISGFGSKPHPHPIHKTLELNLLKNVWVNFATAPSTVLFMKESKFEKIKKIQKNFTKLINYQMTARDASRYTSTSKELPTTPNVFMHDALMYFEPAQIVDLFLRSPNVERLYASLVVPPESSFSTNFSFHPQIYRYHISDGTLHYFLESNQAHSYSQPASAINWLRTTKLQHPDITLTITVLDSFGPLHHLLIQRGEPPISPDNDIVSFHHPECILLPAPNDIEQNFSHRLVPATVYHALFTYVRAVRTLRITDPAGFVRTQSNKPEYSWVHSAAWDNLQQFAVLTAPYRPISHYMIFRSPLARFMHLVKTHHFQILKYTASIASASCAFSSFLVSRLFTHQVVNLVLFRKQVVFKPQTLSQILTNQIRKSPPPFIKLPKLPMFKVDLAPRPNSLFKWQIPAHISLGPVNRFLKHPKIPKWFVLGAATASVIPLAMLLHRWVSGPDTPQSIHDEYMRYFHPSTFQLTIKRQPMLIPKTKEFIQEAKCIKDPAFEAPEMHYGKPTFKEASSNGTYTKKDEDQEKESKGNEETMKESPVEEEETKEAEPEGKAQASLAPNKATNEPEMQMPPPFVNPNSEPAPISPTPVDVPTFQTAQPEFSFPSFPDLPRVFNLNDPERHPTPPASPIEEEVIEMEMEPDRLGMFSQKLPPVHEDSEPLHPLESDDTAVGPIVLFSELVPQKFVNNSGDFITRRRKTWDQPLPEYPTKTDCLLKAVSKAINVPTETLWNDLCHILPDSLLKEQIIYQEGLLTDHLAALASIHRFSCTVHSKFGAAEYGLENAPNHFHIVHSENPGHFEYSVGPPSAKITEPIQGASSLNKTLKEFKFQDQYLPFERVHQHTVNSARAKNLISNMKNGFDGILSQIDHAHPSKGREAILALDQACDVPRRNHKVSLIHISGFAGCGKTKPVAALLKRKDFQQYRIVVPTTELRHEWKTLLNLDGPQSWRVSTWESALLKTAPILVIDEVYKLPRGYLDLALTADPTIKLVIVLGDPLQGEYHSTSASSTNSKLSSEIQYLLKYIDYYCLWSYRIPQNVAQFFKIKSFNSQPGFSAYTRQININAPVLTCAANTAKTLQQCGYNALTVSSSQGSTYQKPITLLLDRNCNLLSPHHTLVALTRSKTGMFFTGDLSILSAANQNQMLQAFAAKQSVSLEHIFNDIFNRLPILTEPIKNRTKILRGGAQEPKHVLIPANLKPLNKPDDFKSLPMSNHSIKAHHDQVKAYQKHVNSTTASICDPEFHGDVLLHSTIKLGDGTNAMPQVDSTFVPNTRRPLHFDIPSAVCTPVVVEAAHYAPAPAEPVYPGADFLTLAATFQPAHDPEIKEILFRDQRSNQFPFLDHPQLLGPQPISLIAPVHNAKHDPTLLLASISKRLRFRESDAPYQITAQDTLLGTLLFQSLCRARRRNPNNSIPFNQALFIECINLNEYAQLTSKTQKVIMSNAFRSDPDWRWTAVRIFSKTQHKINEGSIFGDWKACQTLALMHDALILIFGPVKKYQRIIDASDQPDNIYIHAGNTPFELSSWCQNHLTESIHVANDYTAFDQSQHGEAVVLEMLKMQYVNIPENIIHLHKQIKTSIETQFGPLTCMRLTGEPGTYDDNTDYNLAVMFLQYQISGQGVLVSGDDSLIDSLPPTRPEWISIQPMLNLKFKTEMSRYGLFCGYYVGKEGACRSPKALFAKLAVAFDDGTHYEKLPSYLTEFAIGHSLGDAMWNLFPADDVLFQSANFDYFCRFASRSQKVLLRLGEPDPEALNAIADQVKHASYALFSLMSSTARTAYLKLKSKVHFPSNPEIDSIQRELLSFSIINECLPDSHPTLTTKHRQQETPFPTTNLHQPQPRNQAPLLRGGSSPSPRSHPPLPIPLPQKKSQGLQLLLPTSNPSTLTISTLPDSSPPTQKLPPVSSFSTPPMESALLSLLSSALQGLPFKSSSSTSSDDPLVQAAGSGALPLPGTHDTVVSAPKANPPPTHSLRPPPTVKPLRSDLIRHFQWNCYDLTGVETGTTSIDIITKNIITNLAKPYQTARLLNLEACVMSTHNAIKYPITVEILWAPASADIPQDRIMSTYGATRFVAGSLMNPSEHMVAPCDLAVCNPTVKSSVNFNDNPKLYIKFWENADSKKLGTNALISASIFIRGDLELTAPVTCATY